MAKPGYCKKCNRPQYIEMCDICLGECLESELVEAQFQRDLTKLEAVIFQLVLQNYSKRYIIGKLQEKYPTLKKGHLNKKLDFVKSSWAHFKGYKE